MFENITQFFKKAKKKEEKKDTSNSRNTAKERLHLVLMQDRANVSADFLELMKQEIIEVIKKYIEIDESAIDVRLTNKENEDGTNGAPALYANIPIKSIKNEARKVDKKDIEEHENEHKEEKTEQEQKDENEENVQEQNDSEDIEKPEEDDSLEEKEEIKKENVENAK